MFGFGGKPKIDDQAPPVELRSIADPTAMDFAIFGISPSSAGVAVNPITALRVPAVAAGVKAISEAVGILPMHSYERAAGGARNRVFDHPAYSLLNGDAAPWMRGGQLRELMTADAIVHGDAFAMVVRDGDNLPRELHRLHPSTISIDIDRLTGEPRYRVTTDAGQRVLSYLDVLHLRAPSPIATNAIQGKSPLMEARDAIGLLIALQQHASRLFKNGGRPSGILSFPILKATGCSRSTLSRLAKRLTPGAVVGATTA